MPLYALGLMGATRRMQHYPDPHWQPLMLVALGGAVVIFIGIALTVVQLAVSIRDRRANRDETGDPWNGRTLEWSTASPPPSWNFSVMPNVEHVDQYWETKRAGTPRRISLPSFGELHLPRNTPVGVILAFFAVVLGFALVWHIDWLAAVALLGAVAVALREFWKTDREDFISAEQVAAFEREHGVPSRYLVPALGADTAVGIGSAERDRVPVVAGGES